MSVADCAALVERGDPDRFLAAMAAPPPARAVLFPLYAFNLQIARAPQVTSQPLIAEMRLQWWRDALAEIAAGQPVRRHEVTLPLAEILDATGASLLDGLVEARRRDIGGEPFADTDDLRRYLDATAGTLMWVAARALGATTGEGAIRAIAAGQGLANWFLACPALAARGQSPLPDPSDAAIAGLAASALAGMAAARPPRIARPALLAAWRAAPLLRQARRHPERVLNGTLGQSDFTRRATLLLQSLAPMR